MICGLSVRGVLTEYQFTRYSSLDSCYNLQSLVIQTKNIMNVSNKR